MFPGLDLYYVQITQPPPAAGEELDDLFIRMVSCSMFPGLDLCYIQITQPPPATGEELDDLSEEGLILGYPRVCVHPTKYTFGVFRFDFMARSMSG